MDEMDLVESAWRWTREQMEVAAGHDFGHIERVVTNAKRLGKVEGADGLVVRLAAITHDVVNLPKDDPDRHLASSRSAEAVSTWLEGRLEPARIDLVAEAIRCHSYSAGCIPESVEAKVVSDADNLDAIGAVGIARCFEIGGKLGRVTLATDDPFCDERTPDDGTYTVDHFYTKLLRLGERFYTASGRREAKQRIEFMKEYLEQLRREVEETEASGCRDVRFVL